MEKLIRDNYETIIEANRLYKDVDSTKQKWLFKKLQEELFEVINSSDESELIEELADMHEVILSILKTVNISFESVEELARVKRNKFGSFDKVLILKK